MGFFSNIIGATVKVALTPVAVVSDAVKVVTGNEPDTTKKIVKSAVQDIENAMDDIT